MKIQSSKLALFEQIYCFSNINESLYVMGYFNFRNVLEY